MIPSKNQPQWVDLIKGKLNPDLSSFSLKMKISSVQKNVKFGGIKMEEAIDDLYALCERYEKIYKEDIDKIFKN